MQNPTVQSSSVTPENSVRNFCRGQKDLQGLRPSFNLNPLYFEIPQIRASQCFKGEPGPSRHPVEATYPKDRPAWVQTLEVRLVIFFVKFYIQAFELCEHYNLSKILTSFCTNLVFLSKPHCTHIALEQQQLLTYHNNIYHTEKFNNSQLETKNRGPSLLFQQTQHSADGAT